MKFYKKLNEQKILFILFFYLSLNSLPSIANNYSIYLIRHAEQLHNTNNPALTFCGKFRAKQLAIILSQANITHIYSTHYQRTMQTVKPLANKQKIAIKNYNSKHLEQFSLKLQQQKANTLVVGDSNFIPRLVELLTKKAIAPLTEKDYQQLSQIQYIDKEVILTIFKQPLLCK